VTKEELFEEVWNGAAVEENNLTQSISALRKALGEKRGENRYIVTDPSRGYVSSRRCRMFARKPPPRASSRPDTNLPVRLADYS